MHVMLDLETLGTRPGCAIRSVGAVTFDLGSRVGEEFYANVDLGSCLGVGLTIEAGTLLWWEDQAPEARAALRRDPVTLDHLADQFTGWFRRVGGECVWSQGSDFDGPILAAALARVTRVVPWKFHNARDTRTAYALAGFDPRSVPREGTYHNALDDARHQVACVQAAVKRLREGGGGGRGG